MYESMAITFPLGDDGSAYNPKNFRKLTYEFVSLVMGQPFKSKESNYLWKAKNVHKRKRNMFLVCRMIIATSDAPCAAGGERRPCGDDVEVLPVISITTIRGALASCSHQDMNEGLKHAYRRMLDELPAEFLRDCVKIEEEDGRVDVIIEATYIVQQLMDPIGELVLDMEMKKMTDNEKKASKLETVSLQSQAPSNGTEGGGGGARAAQATWSS